MTCSLFRLRIVEHRQKCQFNMSLGPGPWCTCISSLYHCYFVKGTRTSSRRLPGKAISHFHAHFLITGSHLTLSRQGRHALICAQKEREMEYLFAKIPGLPRILSFSKPQGFIYTTALWKPLCTKVAGIIIVTFLTSWVLSEWSGKQAVEAMAKESNFPV